MSVSRQSTAKPFLSVLVLRPFVAAVLRRQVRTSRRLFLQVSHREENVENLKCYLSFPAGWRKARACTSGASTSESPIGICRYGTMYCTLHENCKACGREQPALTVRAPFFQDLFGKYGALADVWVARKPPGFAFVKVRRLAGTIT